MTKYVCKNCNYSFSARIADECLFCGMSSVEEEKNADDLIDEVSKLFDN